MYSQRDSNVKTSVCSRDAAAAPLIVLEGGEAVAPVRFDHASSIDDGQVAPVLAYSFCLEATRPSEVRA